MPRQPTKLSLAFLMLSLAAIACSFSFSSAKVENVRLASDEAGAFTTTTFGQEDTFYLLGDLKNAPDDTKLKATWIAVDVQNTDPETLIDEVEVVGGSGPFTFTLRNNAPLWPAGKYRVDLYLNDELNQTVDFMVQQTVQVELLDLRLALDSEGNQPVDGFPHTENFYLVGRLANSQGNADVRVVWSAVSLQENQIPDSTAPIRVGVIDEQNQQAGDGSISFLLQKNHPYWPAGQYSVDIYLNDTLVKTIGFQVEGGSDVTVEQAFMAFDQDGASPTDIYSTSDKFFLIADFINIPSDGVPVKVVWIAASVDGDLPENHEINTYEGVAQNGRFWASLTSNSGTWPTGAYKADLYLDGNLMQTLEFRVESGGATSSQGAALEAVFLALDEDGNIDTEIFTPSDTFYLIGELVNAPQGAQIEAIWTAEEVEGLQPNEVVSESTVFDFNEGRFSISLKRDSGVWGKGKYKVDVQLNGQVASTRNFLVTDVKVINPFMATDDTGNQKVEVYGSKQAFYLHLTLGNAPSSTKITTKWYKLASGAGDDQLLNDNDYTFGTGSYYVQLTSNSGVWETGEYVVDIYLNDYFSSSVYFSVQ